MCVEKFYSHHIKHIRASGEARKSSLNFNFIHNQFAVISARQMILLPTFVCMSFALFASFFTIFSALPIAHRFDDDKRTFLTFFPMKYQYYLFYPRTTLPLRDTINVFLNFFASFRFPFFIHHQQTNIIHKYHRKSNKSKNKGKEKLFQLTNPFENLLQAIACLC